MKKIINYLKKIFKIKEEIKHEYIVILKSGDQSINFEATSKEFKKLFKTLKGIKVFKADNVIVPLSSILYWYIETEETKKIKEKNQKSETERIMAQQTMMGGVEYTPDTSKSNKEESKKKGRSKKSK